MIRALKQNIEKRRALVALPFEQQLFPTPSGSRRARVLYQIIVLYVILQYSMLCVVLCIHIYIYIQREREIERERDIYYHYIIIINTIIMIIIIIIIIVIIIMITISELGSRAIAPKKGAMKERGGRGYIILYYSIVYCSTVYYIMHYSLQYYHYHHYLSARFSGHRSEERRYEGEGQAEQVLGQAPKHQT